MDGGASWTSAVTTALTSTASDVTGFMVQIVAVGLGVFALQWGVRKGIRFFKSTTN